MLTIILNKYLNLALKLEMKMETFRFCLVCLHLIDEGPWPYLRGPNRLSFQNKTRALFETRNVIGQA